MKSFIRPLAVFTLLASCSFSAYAGVNYVFRFGAEGVKPVPVQEETPGETNETTYSEWVNSGQPTNCAEWSPDVGTVDYDTSFVQYKECQQLQERTVTRSKLDQSTNELVVIGQTTETKTTTVSESRQAVGTKLDSPVCPSNSDLFYFDEYYTYVPYVTTYKLRIMWNGKNVYDAVHNNGRPQSITTGGFTYTRQEFVRDVTTQNGYRNDRYYKVCISQ